MENSNTDAFSRLAELNPEESYHLEELMPEGDLKPMYPKDQMEEYTPDQMEILELNTKTGKFLRLLFDGDFTWMPDEVEKLNAFKEFLQKEGLYGKGDE